MFPDSTVAKKFTLGKDKCIYVVNYGIAPNFRSILVKNIHESDFSAVSFDESLNSLMQMGQMDVVVSYLDNPLNRAFIRYLGSTFIGHARHKDLFQYFNQVLEPFDASKVLQIAMDGPNVNWAFYTEPKCNNIHQL